MGNVSTLITALVAVYLAYDKFFGDRKTMFINTITAERMKWIAKLRENISTYCGLAHKIAHHISSDTETNRKEKEELEKLRVTIILQLNPREKEDRYDAQICSGVYDVFYHAVQQDKEALNASIEDLITPSQWYLKDEWERVKIEAEVGKVNNKKKDEVIYEWLVEIGKGTKRLWSRFFHKR